MHSLHGFQQLNGDCASKGQLTPESVKIDVHKAVARKLKESESLHSHDFCSLFVFAAESAIGSILALLQNVGVQGQ